MQPIHTRPTYMMPHVMCVLTGYSEEEVKKLRFIGSSGNYIASIAIAAYGAEKDKTITITAQLGNDPNPIFRLAGKIESLRLIGRSYTDALTITGCEAFGVTYYRAGEAIDATNAAYAKAAMAMLTEDIRPAINKQKALLSRNQMERNFLYQASFLADKAKRDAEKADALFLYPNTAVYEHKGETPAKKLMRNLRRIFRDHGNGGPR